MSWNHIAPSMVSACRGQLEYGLHALVPAPRERKPEATGSPRQAREIPVLLFIHPTAPMEATRSRHLSSGRVRSDAWSPGTTSIRTVPRTPLSEPGNSVGWAPAVCARSRIMAKTAILARWTRLRLLAPSGLAAVAIMRFARGVTARGQARSDPPKCRSRTDWQPERPICTGRDGSQPCRSCRRGIQGRHRQR